MFAITTIITTVASLGIDAVITNAVKFITPENATRLTKALMGVGTAAISYAAGKKITEYIEEDVCSVCDKILEKKDDVVEKMNTPEEPAVVIPLNK